MQPQQTIHTGKHIPQLDGLRGMAILMVVCYHYFPGSILCNFGWSGVDLFFVLSGFLITGRLLPYLSDKKILQKFYRNRFLRIVPLYFCFLILFFLCWFLLTSKETLHSFRFYNEHWWQFFLFIQNWVFIFNFPLQATHLNHLWSIAIEEQFYLIFPLFILLIRNQKRLVTIGFALLFVILLTRCIYFNWFLANNENDKIYWNTFLRMDSLLMGFILYVLFQKKNILLKIHRAIKYLSWATIILLAGGIVFYKTAKIENPFLTTFGFTLIAIMYGYLLYVTLLKRNIFLNALTLNGFLRYTGKISYGMYIIHWPLLLLGFAVLNKLNTGLGENSLLFINATCCIPLTYLLSHISFKYFESFFLKRKAKFA